MFKLEDECRCIDEAKCNIKELIPTKVLEEDVGILGLDILAKEIRNAICKMCNDKACRIDGLHVEFFKNNLEWIRDELL